MGEQDRAHIHQSEAGMSGRQFLLALLVIAVVIAAFALLLLR